MDIHAPDTFNGAKLLGVFQSGSPEWHEVRADGIGGSEVGTILGLNRWESAYYLWLLKTGQLPQKHLDSFAVKLGTLLEPVIMEQILPDKYPDWEIYTTGTYQHPTWHYMHANPDGLALIDGEWVVVEVKTSRNYWDQVPPAYIAQVMHYMNIMGLKKAVIVGLVAMDWVEYWIDYDEFEARVIEQRCAEFWQSVLDETQPAWDGSQSTYEAVRQLHPDIDGSEVEIEALFDLANAQSRFDDADADLRKIKSQILAAMGKAQHAYMEIDGQKHRIASRVSYKGGSPYLRVHRS